MNENELLEILDGLLSLKAENEVVEFKEAKNNFDFNDIGEYFSALSNEANLKGKKYSWLVFGVKNDHSIIGTNYRNNTISLHKLKEEIGNKTTDRTTFIEIYEVEKNEKRVILFQIPPAPRGLPISWDGHYYSRNNESLQPLSIEKLERIRSQSVVEDFSIKICETATIDDLDIEAIKKARELYSQKNPEKLEEIKTWDDITFLNKAKITIQGKITNTAIILLGKSESEHFLSPAISKISWILKDRDGIELDYEHFSCPFLLTAEKVFNKIRNLKYRYMNSGSLFPEEVDKYEPYIIREALNNCIAHQDYTMAGKINVIENNDSLIFTNSGKFIPETLENVIESNSPSEYYRNRFLADAMVNLKMIDTIGSGIRKMFIIQKNKYFPLPEYDFKDNKVSLTIIGKVLDVNYAKKLAQSKDKLSLEDIILLDKVQKKKELTKTQITYLKKQGFIEGTKPNFHISLKVAEGTELISDYVKLKGFKDEHYKKLIIEFISKNKGASKQDIDKLLLDILPNVLDDEKKKNKVRNILYSMSKKERVIYNSGTSRYPIWKKV
ncbi:MAG: putative DNA binding domain-containing protein [Candidatus Gracilibacteria bacterium]|nr:putative DNA binding domain-containing protein [Candidatus Gracilibacteria bacterium]